jgi:hypothetical protein
MMKANLAAESSQPTAGKKKSNKSVGIGFANLARTIASEWKTLDPDTKAPYEARAAQEKSRYDTEMLVWRAKQREEKAATTASASKGARAELGAQVSSSYRTTVEFKTSDRTPEVARRPSGAVDFSLQAQVKNSPTDLSQPSGMQPSPLSDPTNMSLQGTPSAVDDMMMGAHFPFRQAQQQQHQRDEIGWAGFPSMSPSPGVVRGSSFMRQDMTGPISDFHPSGFQTMLQDDDASSPFHRMGGLPDPRQQFMMMQQQQQQHFMANMSGGGGGGDARRLGALSNNPNSIMAAMIGDVGEYEHQSRSLVANMGGHQVADQTLSSMNHSISDFQRQSLALNHDIFPERRNTWSGMSQAQQDTFHQMQMERLQKEEEALQAQLVQHRRMYMEHERQIQRERQRRSSLREVDHIRSGRPPIDTEELAAHRVGHHPDSWTELTPETQAKLHGHDETRLLDELSPHQLSSNRYPSSWFEADSNMVDAKGKMNEDLLRYSPDPQGDLNQKLFGRAKSSSLAPSLNGQQAESGIKEGTKSEGDLWNPIQLKRKESDSSSCLKHDGEKNQELTKSRGYRSVSALPDAAGQQNLRVDPSSVQALGMRLDDESVSFLANLRFEGCLNTPDGSPASGNSR